MLRIGVCLFLATFVASPVLADEVDDFFKKADDLRYSPADHGLKDLKVEMKNSMLAMNPMMAKLKIFLFWKSPDMKAAKIEGAEGPMAAQMGQMAEGMKSSLGIVVPQPYHTQKDKFDFKVEKDADGVRLVGIPKEGSEEAKMVTKVTTWFDDRGLPIRQESEGQATAKMEMTYVEKDGKFLLDTMKGEMNSPMGQAPTSMSVKYTQIEGMWFPETMDQEMGGMKIQITYTGYEVNKGLEDSIFETKATGGGK